MAGSVIGSVVGAGASLFGADEQASAAKSAAKIQQQEADKALAQQQNQFNQTTAQLAPYRALGENGADTLYNRLAEVTTPVTMNQQALQQTPGYQFNLTQGLRAAGNSAAARGLGVSGAAMKGASTFATGLADNTYQNQFNNAITNQQNIYNRLLGSAQLGENAAAQTGALGQSSAQNQSNLLASLGNALGGSQVAQGQAWANGLSGAASGIASGVNNYQQQNMLMRLLGQSYSQSANNPQSANNAGMYYSNPGNGEAGVMY